ncbi:MAG TPA: mechanosensitive ion channel domain-containing protein [Pseudogracilibacillus sp.]|nr:mechanosensitive ion channel domain-containing protein [Pseudogracilibacillus sp.]
MFLISVVLMLGVWVNVKNSIILIFAAIVGVTIFSIRNLSTNLVAWLMLLRKQYFKLYDRIEINGIVGDMIKITPFYFKLMERGNNLSSATPTGP